MMLRVRGNRARMEWPLPCDAHHVIPPWPWHWHWLRLREPSQAALCACVTCMGRVAPPVWLPPRVPNSTRHDPAVSRRDSASPPRPRHRHPQGDPPPARTGGTRLPPSPGPLPPPGRRPRCCVWSRMQAHRWGRRALIKVARGGIRPIPDLDKVLYQRTKYSELCRTGTTHSRTGCRCTLVRQAWRIAATYRWLTPDAAQRTIIRRWWRRGRGCIFAG